VAVEKKIKKKERGSQPLNRKDLLISIYFTMEMHLKLLWRLAIQALLLPLELQHVIY
jgi:hypothetical protein